MITFHWPLHVDGVVLDARGLHLRLSHLCAQDVEAWIDPPLAHVWACIATRLRLQGHCYLQSEPAQLAP